MKGLKTLISGEKRVSTSIWLISFFFPPDFGGSSTRSWNFAKALTRKGYTVGVVSSFPQYPYGKTLYKRYQGKLFVFEEIEGVRVARFRLPPLPHEGIVNRLILFTYFLVLSIILRPYCKRFLGNPDLIYSQTPAIFSAIIGKAYAKAENVPLIVDCHDMWPDVFSIIQSPALPLLVSVGRALARFAYQSGNAVTIWGVKACDVLSTAYGVPRRRIFPVYTGVDTSTFRPMEKKSAMDSLNGYQELENLEKKFVLLYTGAVNRYYNFDFLLKLAESLKENSTVAFLIAGEGEEKEKLVKICQTRNLSNVTFCSYLPRQELVHFRINLADLCVIPLRENSDSSAAFDPYELEIPTKLFEYTSCARPVLCLGRGESKEILAEWNAGIGVNSDVDLVTKTILELSKDKTKAATMGKSARRLAEEVFSLEEVGKKLDEIIFELQRSRLSSDQSRDGHAIE